MRPENVWKWLDAVDQDHLDPLDQWGIPPSRRSPEDTSPRSDSLSDTSARESYQQYNDKSNIEVASLLQTIPPTGILLRNGSVKDTGQNPKFFVYNGKNENHPQSLLPGFPTSFAKHFEGENHPLSLRPGFPTNFAQEMKSVNHPELLRPGFPTNFVQDVETGNRSWSKKENHPQSLLPGFPTSFAKHFEGENHPLSLRPGFPTNFAQEMKSENHPELLRPGFPTNFERDVETGNRSQSFIPGFATSSGVIRQQMDASSNRRLQTSGREGNSESAKPKRLPSFTERAGVHGLSGTLHSTPVIHVQVKDPVAIKCQGARFVGGYQQNGLESLPSASKKPRIESIGGEGALQRGNAVKILSNSRAGPKVRPGH